MQIFGAVGRIGSGKDAVVEYLGDKYNLPSISVGDMVREMAKDKGLSLSRENLEQLASESIQKHGNEFFMKRVIARIREKGWRRAGVTGIRTPAEVRWLKHEIGENFVLLHVYIEDPEIRYKRVAQRGREGDPQSYAGFLEQGRKEEEEFHIEQAASMADYSLDNSGPLEDLHLQIDEIIQRLTAQGSGLCQKQALASKELELTRREIELAKKEAELAWEEADHAEHEADQRLQEQAEARHAAQRAEAEKMKREEKLVDIQQEIEAAQARKQALLAEIEAAEKKAKAVEADLEAKQAEAERQEKEQEAERKQKEVAKRKKAKEAEKEKRKDKKARKGPSLKEREQARTAKQAKQTEARKKAKRDEAAGARRSARKGKGKEAERVESDRQKKQSQADNHSREKKAGKAPYEKQSLQETLDALNADPQKGLSSAEAQKRIDQYGPNAIEEEKKNPLIRFLSYFWGPIPWMLEAASALSAAVRHWEEFAIIFTMLLINGGVSWWHERKAGSAIEALKARLSPEAQVIRDGKKQKIQAKQLVPGDIVIIKMGDLVPADAKLLQDQQLAADESSLTGESLPVNKQAGDAVYSGTTVKQGEAKTVVAATGENTKFARTVQLVEAAGESSHFQKAVMRIGYFLIGLTILLVAGIVTITLLRDRALAEVILFAMVVLIAGIPQALPAVLTITMTVGANRLAAMKAIVSKLSSMEEMAGLEILFSDKTGTLTKNELELREPVLLSADDPEKLILAAALTVKSGSEDPIDKAVMAGLEDRKQLRNYTIRDFRPFDPTRKRAEADVEKDGETFSVAKGAPQVILELVDADDSLRREVSEKVAELGEQGFRALGVAQAEQEDDWEYLGIMSLLDPPREDAADVIGEAQDHGIDIRMVTGDHAAIGKQVAGLVGLRQKILEATAVFDEEGNSRVEEQELLSADGFAEVTPEHKFEIIKHFQQSGKITGMTGDGVNDAPALKQADVGIAVEGATDAARSAAHLVLTAPGLGVITHAVEEARRIFERMISYATFRITETLHVLFFVSIAIFFFNVFPVTPIMVALLSILNDIPIIAIAWDNARMPENPVRWDMPRVLSLAAMMGACMVAASFLLYWYATEGFGLPTGEVQSLMFLHLLVGGHMTIFLTRNRGWLWQRPFPSLVLFIPLELTQLAGTAFVLFGWLIHAAPWQYVLIVWGYSIVGLFIINIIKVLMFKLFGWQTGIKG